MNEEPRKYVRSQRTGQRGWLVADGTKVQLDLPARSEVPFTEEWVLAEDEKQFTLHQVAEVAYEADRQLLRALGRHREARTEWRAMSPEKRTAWMALGPRREPPDHLRFRLYDSIMGVLRPLAK